MKSRALAIAAAAVLAACQPSAPAPTPGSLTPATAAPASVATVAAPATGMGAAAPTGYDETIVNFGGYASARFNVDADAVRRAYGGPLDAAPPPESPEACHYLLSKPRSPDGFGIAFMMEGGKFVRYDVDSRSIIAPGGLAVGQRIADVQAAFGAAVQVQPHKYVKGGKVVVVAPADGGEARLVFETDADGVVTAWRIGLEPQVHYVEGCS